MEPIKLTIKEVNEKAQMLNSIQTNANDKLNYAIKKVFKNIERGVAKVKTDYNRSIEDARIKYASTYPKDHPEVEKRGLLITDVNGAYSYTPEATTAFNKEVRPLNDAFENAEVYVEPYHVGEGVGFERVATIDLFIKEELTGLLFSPLVISGEPKVAPMHIERNKVEAVESFATTTETMVEPTDEEKLMMQAHDNTE